MQIPDWVLSNYFYREMSTTLRWILLPFLLLSGATIAAMVGEALRILGIFDYNILFHNPLMSRLGIIDNVLQVVIGINCVFLVLFGVPMAVFFRDLKRTLNSLSPLDEPRRRRQISMTEAPYLEGAQAVFQKDDQVVAFVFGHTHRAFLKRLGPTGQVVLNTGTWLKLLHRVPARFGLVPPIYYPLFRLNYFCIHLQDNHLAIDYVEIAKKPAARAHLIAARNAVGEDAKASRGNPSDNTDRIVTATS